ncbi:hypothetical protein OPT61_g2184 [Boeremia exigua]|uniref:Uncharacterized protein n=1 Tax=Boeremia exigua TaxID=749465 RepID=A0ACC2IMJ1_9PLEO|nr:hypothetical protein OPT61_g2184 [Boeremia exigua]
MQITSLLFALVSLLAVAFGSSSSPVCKEGSRRCGAGRLGGAVFTCKDGRWQVPVACSTPETCTSHPVALCAMISARSADEGTEIISGFEMSAAEMSAVDSGEVRTTLQFQNVHIPIFYRTSKTLTVKPPTSPPLTTTSARRASASTTSANPSATRKARTAIVAAVTRRARPASLQAMFVGLLSIVATSASGLTTELLAASPVALVLTW